MGKNKDMKKIHSEMNHAALAILNTVLSNSKKTLTSLQPKFLGHIG